MRSIQSINAHISFVLVTILSLQSGCALATAQTETVLYTFRGGSTDGFAPSSRSITNSAGNLYGTTFYGGSGPCQRGRKLTGCGTVFELTPGNPWTETVLYNFTHHKAEGAFPKGGLVFDKAGNLYGTTFQGGGPNARDCVQIEASKNQRRFLDQNDTLRFLLPHRLLLAVEYADFRLCAQSLWHSVGSARWWRVPTLAARQEGWSLD